ncbi:MAG: flavodoxin domain-containing protein [Xanthomonadales bacterium]|nr:flavodoxin domain-containing protein [Xanthomonadales bacterium]
MSASSSTRSGAWLGNLAVGLVLLSGAIALLAWQRTPLAWADPGPVRIGAAIAVILAYVGACTLGLAWRCRRQVASTAVAADEPGAGATAAARRVLVAFASQTGFAEQLATRTAQALRAAGVLVELRALGAVDADCLAAHERALFVASTTGEGDAPDSAAGFVRDMLDARLDLSRLHYGVLALGDSEYVNYCAFGHRLEAWLQDARAKPLFDLVEVDNGDDGALRHWQHHLGQIAGRADLPDWQVPDYGRWRLAARDQVNPGSIGAPCFRLVLEPAPGTPAQWQAGDIAEVGPCQAPADVARWLAALRLDAEAQVEVAGVSRRFGDLVARSVLPAVDEVVGFPAALLAARLKPLPHREFSIASIPGDGVIELLLRQMRGPDGRLGIGTGWLTEYASIGADIALRVRGNPNFHAPPDARPLILIGNGTGLAGLRALLRERIAAGRHRNWLLFGERNAAHDYYWREEIEAAHASGALERLDRAFSRDAPTRVYVQHRLLAQAQALLEWVEQGASIHVCGSLEGMAPGVDAVLREVLGEARVQGMLASGRYRRDVY